MFDVFYDGSAEGAGLCVYPSCFTRGLHCVPLDLTILIIFLLSNRETRIGRMAYVRVMLMDLSCMRTGIKI